MKYLNLRKDYPTWSWNENEERLKGYEALINRSYTKEFAREIWNDMVDLLNNMLKEIELKWDDKYATLAGTKFNIILIFFRLPVNFTAKMFNSFRYNIEKLINTTWRWRYDTNYEGFIGRTDVVGDSQTKYPDTLYGSMIIELANKLNTLISVMKAEPIIKHYQSYIRHTSKYNSNVSFCNPINLKTSDSNSMSTNATLMNADIMKMSASSVATTSSDSALKISNKIKRLGTSITSISTVDAIITLEDLYKNLYSTVFHFTSVKAKLEVNYHNIKVKINIPNNLLTNTFLHASDVKRMIVDSINYSVSNSDLISDESIRFNVDQIAELTSKAIIEAVKTKQIRSNKKIYNEIGCANLELFHGATFIGLVFEKAKINTNMFKAVASRASSRVGSRANISIPKLINLVAIHMNSVVTMHSEFTGEAVKALAIHQDSTINHSSGISGVLNKNPVNYYNSRTTNFESSQSELVPVKIKFFSLNRLYKLGISSTIRVCGSIKIDANEINSLGSSSTMMLWSSTDSMLSDSTSKIWSNSKLENIKYDYYPTVNASFTVLNESDLALGNPIKFEIDYCSHTYSDSTIYNLDASTSSMIYINAFEELLDVALDLRKLVSFRADTRLLNKTNIDLSFDPSSWMNPVKVNDVLEVYQVIEATKTDNNLDLD